MEKECLAHLNALETRDLHNAFHHALQFAMNMTSRRGEAGIVMIDEFQVLTKVYEDELKQMVDITPAFQKPAEASWCPMVVSGSDVSLVTETVMGGPLLRRFRPYYLNPFEQHSVEYAYKLSQSKPVKLSELAAAEIHRLTGGNPYYIWCFFNSLGLQEKDLSTVENVQSLYTFETTDMGGRVRQFWDTHFNAFSDKINHDKIGLQCLYQLATAKQEIRIEEIAQALEVEPKRVRRVLKNLEEADLITRQTGAYYTDSDQPKALNRE